MFKKTWIKYIIGIVGGGVAGFLYYTFIGCQSGSCTIASNPYIATVYGVVLGALIASLFRKRKKSEQVSGDDAITPLKDGSLVVITTQNFNDEILQSDQLVMVDFWASWCGPCKMLTPLIKEIAKENTDRIKGCSINTEQEPDLSRQYGIQSIPTVIFFKDGKEIERMIGVHDKQTYLNIIETHS